MQEETGSSDNSTTIALAVALPLAALLLACCAALLLLRHKRNARRKQAAKQAPYQDADAADLMTLPATSGKVPRAASSGQDRPFSISSRNTLGAASGQTSEPAATPGGPAAGSVAGNTPSSVSATTATGGSATVTDGKLQTYGALTKSSAASDEQPGDAPRRRQTLLDTTVASSEGSAAGQSGHISGRQDSCDVPLERIVPPGMNTSGLTFGGCTVSLPATNLAATDRAQLCAALDNVLATDAPQPFVQRYVLLAERKEGSQVRRPCAQRLARVRRQTRHLAREHTQVWYANSNPFPCFVAQYIFDVDLHKVRLPAALASSLRTVQGVVQMARGVADGNFFAIKYVPPPLRTWIHHSHRCSLPYDIVLGTVAKLLSSVQPVRLGMCTCTSTEHVHATSSQQN